MPLQRALVRSIVWVSSLALALAAVSSIESPASAADTGLITGTLTGPHGEPAQEVAVTAYQVEDDAYSTLTSVVTASDGTYTLPFLPPGTYRLRFSDLLHGDYLTEYWDDAASLDGATDIEVTSGQPSTGKDAELATASHISGTVTGPDGEPVEDAMVGAYRTIPGELDWKFVTVTHTAADGSYDVGGLTAGTYYLGFDDRNGRFVSEYWDDAHTVESAVGIAVDPSETVGGKDAELSAAGRIRGTVTGVEDEPVGGVEVVAYDWDSSTGEQTWAADAITDSDGGYDLGGLAPGTYRVLFDGTSAGYLDEYWTDAATIELADDVTVTAGAAADVDAQLALGGEISGTVTGPDGEPVSDVLVSAWSRDPDGLWDNVADSDTETDGSYHFGGLPAGSYRLQFDDRSGHQYAEEFWDNATSLQTATAISVVPGQTASGKDAQLADAGHITGTVTGPDNQPLSSVAVTAYRNFDDVWEQADSTSTDLDGTYDLGGLESGTYRLRFHDGSGHEYTTEYWDNAPTLAAATDIVVTVGDTFRDKNARLGDVSAPAVVNTAVPTILGTAQVGSTLTATSGTWNPASGVSFGFRWLVAGNVVDGATGATYTPVEGDVGKTVQVQVKAAKAGYTTGTATSAATAAVVAVTPAPATPAVTSSTAPTITGTPTVGTAVTATSGTWSVASATLTYQWLVAGAPVPGASAASYTPIASDAGKTLQVRVTAAAAGYTPATVASAAKAIGKGTLKATKKPKVTGKAKKNATLKVSPGTWSPAKVTVTYRWYAGAKAIPKATAAKLKLAGKTLKAAVGTAISVLVTVAAPGYGTVTTKLKVPGKVQG